MVVYSTILLNIAVYSTILLNIAVYGTILLNIAVYSTVLLNIAVYSTILLNIAVYSSMPHYIVKCSSMPHCIIKCSSIPHLSRYYTLHVIVRGMRIWPPNAAKCYKNAGKFFPDVIRGAAQAYTIGLSINENLKLEKGKEKKSSAG
jgi:hypothetical protein